VSGPDQHLAGDAWWRYPRAGDPMPPGSTKLLLLTKGGICIVGQWIDDGFFTAWSPLPARDKAKEDAIATGVAVNQVLVR